MCNHTYFPSTICIYRIVKVSIRFYFMSVLIDVIRVQWQSVAVSTAKLATWFNAEYNIDICRTTVCCKDVYTMLNDIQQSNYILTGDNQQSSKMTKLCPNCCGIIINQNYFMSYYSLRNHWGICQNTQTASTKRTSGHMLKLTVIWGVQCGPKIWTVMHFRLDLKSNYDLI